MDKLRSQEDNICMWLSSDPDYILDQCGDILSRNEFREVENQSSAVDKMRMLLKIILKKGEDTAQRFLEILKQQQARYPQLQQFFKPSAQGSNTPTVFADGGSVVNARKMENIKAKSLIMKTETVCQPRNMASGNVHHQVPQANWTALNGSSICTDTYNNITIDGDIDLSVTVKSSNAGAGTRDKRLPSSQGPAERRIIEHKVEIIDCLRRDHSYILQLMHQKGIISERQYGKLKHISQPEQTIIDLIDDVIANGEEFCSRFLEVLQEPDVLNTFPQLKEITKNW